jgi:tetratricopeptide (TPR) repeat protein
VENPVDLAHDLIALGHPAEALALLEPLAASGRMGPLGQVTMGRALLACGRTGEAVTVLREAAALARDWPDAAVSFGRALAANGALPAAIAEYQRALRLDRARLVTAVRVAPGRDVLDGVEASVRVIDYDTVTVGADGVAAPVGHVTLECVERAGDGEHPHRLELRADGTWVLDRR